MPLLSAVERWAAWIAACLLVLTGLFLTWEVVARYFFNAPTIWAAELSQLCLIWACPLAMAWVLSTRRHIRVTALTAQASRRMRLRLEIFALLVILVFSLVVVAYGYSIFQDSLMRGRTSGTMLDPPAWIPEAAIPAGFALLALSCLANIARALRGDIPEDREIME